MKRFLLAFFIAVVFFFITDTVNAQQGCCSWHGGIGYCDTSVGRYVCNDGSYSPSCGCTYIRPSPPVFPPSIKATWNYQPNDFPNRTFNISVHLEDENPTQYSAVLNKCKGCNPGPLTDFYSNNFTFNNIGSGKWYLNVKKVISGQWSAIVYWTIDVPTWVQPSPTPTPTPTTIPVTTTDTPPPTNGGGWAIAGILILLFIGGLAVLAIYKAVVWFIPYAKAHDWVYGALFWGAIIGGIIIYNLLSNKSKISNPPTEPVKSRYTCNCSKTCPNMTCTEAYYQLEQCGCTARDGDGDGIPCEAQCK